MTPDDVRALTVQLRSMASNFVNCVDVVRLRKAEFDTAKADAVNAETVLRGVEQRLTEAMASVRTELRKMSDNAIEAAPAVLTTGPRAFRAAPTSTEDMIG